MEQSKKQKEVIDAKDDAINLTEKDNQYIDSKLSKIKSVFSPKILESNPDIAEQLKLADSLQDPIQKEQALQSVLSILKDPKRLKSITDQLG